MRKKGLEVVWSMIKFDFRLNLLRINFTFLYSIYSFSFGRLYINAEKLFIEIVFLNYKYQFQQSFSCSINGPCVYQFHGSPTDCLSRHVADPVFSSRSVAGSSWLVGFLSARYGEVSTAQMAIKTASHPWNVLLPVQFKARSVGLHKPSPGAV